MSLKLTTNRIKGAAILLFLTTGLSAAVHVMQDSGPVEKKLAGEWIWFRTVHSYLGSGVTEQRPEDCRCTKRLIFSNDTISIFQGDTLQSRQKFTLREIRFLKDPVRYALESTDLSQDLSVNGDTLVVGSPGNCGSIEYYSRLKR